MEEDQKKFFNFIIIYYDTFNPNLYNIYFMKYGLTKLFKDLFLLNRYL